ncbi:MAG TPA: hypothetical protein VLH86_02735 [Patescibacteria group bacterium]|nr:hypothetical protein [Patescibacteria group bacterium]
MKKLYILAVSTVAVASIVGSAVWGRAYASNDGGGKNIVGAWFVKAPDAPFQYHMFVFNADGTMQQANPDAGDANTSDSDGKGIWVKDGNKIKGKFVEVTADRTTHAFVNRGEISFEIKVDNNHLTGTAAARFYDENNTLVRGPLPTPLEGTRVTLP